MNAWNNRPLNGCLFEEELSPVGHVVATTNLEDLPTRVDLRQWCSHVEDQQKTNSCTANAIVGALEFHQRRAGLAVTDLSRMFVYYNARKLNDKEAEDCGSYIHHVMAAVLAYGACEEKIWPFDPRLCTTRPSQQAYENAQSHQAVQYGRAPLGPSAIFAVAAGIPVVFATYTPSEFYYHAAQTGSMPMPGPRLEPAGGGHAMLLVGYDLDEECWLARNSYGSGFGQNGYLKIPFETLAAYSIPEHFWTIGAIDKTPGLEFNQQPLDASQLESPSHLKIDLTHMRQQLRQRLAGDLATKSAGFRDRLRT